MIIWLASYPKSGNTWMRSFLISLMIKNKDGLKLKDLENIRQFPTKKQYVNLGINIDFNNFDEVSKYWNIVQSKINSDKKIRFFKTHNAFCKKKENLFTNSKNTLGVIHIVRDPRNVISSVNNHYQHNSLEESKSFLFDKTKGISKDATGKIDIALPQVIGSWQTHYNSWKIIKKNYLLVKYESLINSPYDEFYKVAKYLENTIKIKFDDKQIKYAIEASSFEKLEELEKKEGFTESMIDKKTGKRRKFFFLGPKNNWKNLLDEKIVFSIEKEFKKEMKELGYI